MKRTITGRITDFDGIRRDLRETLVSFAEDLMKRLNPEFADPVYWRVHDETITDVARGQIASGISNGENGIIARVRYVPMLADYFVEFGIPDDERVARRFKRSYDKLLKALGEVATKYALRALGHADNEFRSNEGLSGKTFVFYVTPERRLYYSSERLDEINKKK